MTSTPCPVETCTFTETGFFRGSIAVGIALHLNRPDSHHRRAGRRPALPSPPHRGPARRGERCLYRTRCAARAGRYGVTVRASFGMPQEGANPLVELRRDDVFELARL